MKTQYPIYIPSKGRSDCCYTAEILLAEDIDFYIVVEPQDYEAYVNKYGANRCLSLDENDKGLWYARNFCKEHSSKNKDDYHWELDDNIKKYMIRKNNKNIKCEAAPLFVETENYINQYKNIAMAGFKHVVFAFAATTDLSYNRTIYSNVLLNNNVNATRRPNTIEDIDYTMQCLLQNYCVILFNRYLIDKVTTGALSGGCTEIEHNENDSKRLCEGVLKAYPNSFGMRKVKDRWRIQPPRIWQKFKQRPRNDLSEIKRINLTPEKAYIEWKNEIEGCNLFEGVE